MIIDIIELGTMVQALVMSSVSDPPRPEDQKLFTPNDVYGLIQARLDMFDDTVRSIPQMVKDEINEYFEKRREARAKQIDFMIRKVLPAGGYGGLIFAIIEIVFFL